MQRLGGGGRRIRRSRSPSVVWKLAWATREPVLKGNKNNKEEISPGEEAGKEPPDWSGVGGGGDIRL